jgi:hypothetical protein
MEETTEIQQIKWDRNGELTTINTITDVPVGEKKNSKMKSVCCMHQCINVYYYAFVLCSSDSSYVTTNRASPI